MYEPHHKVRLAIKPGITGMWQVSGRSDITDFEEVVRLDKEYMLMEMAEKELPFEEKIRVLYSISRSMKFMKKNFHGTSYDQIEQKCFATIQQEIFKASNVNQVKKYKIAENQVKVSLPVRVNWGGGWTDTPPYCNEKGGVVLNAAILLNGQEPIEVELRKLPEKHVEFASLDLDAHGVVTTAAEIQDCHNPYDSFALHKAALIACGIIPMEGEADLEKILDEMGGGFYMSTCVKGVPKGSGLGTSSILSGACVRAFGKFLGTNWSDSDVYELVLNLEQIMSTGGGWQDQVGGLTGGIKYITSRSGMKQKLKVEYLDLEMGLLAVVIAFTAFINISTFHIANYRDVKILMLLLGGVIILKYAHAIMKKEYQLINVGLLFFACVSGMSSFINRGLQGTDYVSVLIFAFTILETFSFVEIIRENEKVHMSVKKKLFQ